MVLKQQISLYHFIGLSPYCQESRAANRDRIISQHIGIRVFLSLNYKCL